MVFGLIDDNPAQETTLHLLGQIGLTTLGGQIFHCQPRATSDPKATHLALATRIQPSPLICASSLYPNILGYDPSPAQDYTTVVPSVHLQLRLNPKSLRSINKKQQQQQQQHGRPTPPRCLPAGAVPC